MTILKNSNCDKKSKKSNFQKSLKKNLKNQEEKTENLNFDNNQKLIGTKLKN